MLAMFGKKPTVLGPDVYERLSLKVLNPFEIGSDLVANSVAAVSMVGTDCLVVDFGTALTFTLIQKNEITGVSIAPGLKTAIRSLSQNTAKLFDVPLQLPGSALGKNTVHAIQAGTLFGYEGLVKFMMERIQTEINSPQLPVVATGGLVAVINTLHGLFTCVEPDLTINGLREISELS